MTVTERSHITKALENLGLTHPKTRVIVIGVGVTGVSVAKFLNQHDISFAIVDSREKPPGLAKLQAIIPDLPVFAGPFNPKVLAKGTHLIVSPGVSLEETVIANTLAKGAVLLSDIDIFSCCVKEPIIAITGSNGKSTVTSMVGAMCKEAGKNVGVGGNLGIPALDLIDDLDGYVLELSSFQLERTSKLKAKSSAVLNISSDHMDRYISVDEYARQKSKVFAGSGIMILNYDDYAVMSMRLPGRRTITFGFNSGADCTVQEVDGESWLMLNKKQVMRVNDSPLVGNHNLANALAALAIGSSINLSVAAMVKALQKFQGLEHRMQVVAEVNGVRWINDSKATNIGATKAALEGFSKSVIVVVGGESKGADMSLLAPTLEKAAKMVILIGRDAQLIKPHLTNSVPVYEAGTIKKAVQFAAAQACSGDTVLLSPACASFDQFLDYRDRGKQFTEAVKQIGKKT
ncbi:MAG: UDP-N-acetylmuramoyl-L-alanine--D-glutamate ligase [Methylococcaceae bacterium]